MTDALMDNRDQQIYKAIYKEARLLDDWLLDDWVDLFEEDAIYWVPLDPDSNPREVPSIFYDDKVGMQIRVEQLLRQNRLSQTPRSETIRAISNIEILEHSDTTARARYVMVLYETRTGDWRQFGLGQLNQHVGTCFLDFCRSRSSNSWKIKCKKLVLLQREQPFAGLSFIL